MSRVGKLPIKLPAGVNVSIASNVVTVKGPKGTLTQEYNDTVQVEIKDGEIAVTRSGNDKKSRAQHGLYREIGRAHV